MWRFIMVMVMEKLQDEIQNLKDLRTKKFKIVEYGIIERPRLQPLDGIFIVNDNNYYIGSRDDDISYNKEDEDDVTRKKTLLKNCQIKIEIPIKKYRR